MTTAKVLPIVNAAGCVVLIGFILLQWVGGNALGRKLHDVESRLILEQNARTEAEHHAKKLQGDIEGLKASIDSIRKDAEAHEQDLEARTAEVTALTSGLEDAQEKVKAWEEALKARDEALAERDSKIRELNESLVATRKRLDEAVAALRKAGAR